MGQQRAASFSSSAARELARELAELARQMGAIIRPLSSKSATRQTITRLFGTFRVDSPAPIDNRGGPDDAIDNLLEILTAALLSAGQLAARASPEIFLGPADPVWLSNLLCPTTARSHHGEPLKRLGGLITELASLPELAPPLTRMAERIMASPLLRELPPAASDPIPKPDLLHYFLEFFLEAYNPMLRKRRGVYYTPAPLVNYIVESVDHLLRKDLGFPLGLADPARFSEGSRAGQLKVQILDPAAGSGAFFLAVIAKIFCLWQASNPSGSEWQSYVRSVLLHKIAAFECLPAAWLLCHLKFRLLLSETGYHWQGDEHLPIYLTNTLAIPSLTGSPPNACWAHQNEQAEAMAEQIKETRPISVIIGNPPYRIASANHMPGMQSWLEPFQAGIEHERNRQPLADDYIKFMRFAHWKLAQIDQGIIALVTNNSYLNGLIQRGMRQRLLADFNAIYILNLHGREAIPAAPDSSGSVPVRDENLFPITLGVAIGFYLKKNEALRPARVFYQELRGSRTMKIDFLRRHSLANTDWQAGQPTTPHYSLIHSHQAANRHYQKFWPITQLFSFHSSGIQTHRDHFVVAFSSAELIERLQIFRSNLSDEQIRERYQLTDSHDFQLARARRQVRSNWPTALRPYHYRPFDLRTICYEPELIDRPRLRLMQHLAYDNIALCLMRRPIPAQLSQVLVTRHLTDKNFFAHQTYLFPLYHYNAAGEATPALANPPWQEISSRYGQAIEPLAWFAYIYALLHAPSYRRRYAVGLQEDFPRIPFPRDYELFRQFAQIGRELIRLHLLDLTSTERTPGHFSQPGPIQLEHIGGIRHRLEIAAETDQGRLWLNGSTWFGPISPAVWDYRIGRFPVCQRYLTERAKYIGQLRALETDHFCQIVTAISATLLLTAQLEYLIKKYDNWQSQFEF
jgi:hypothetical protein